MLDTDDWSQIAAFRINFILYTIWPNSIDSTEVFEFKQTLPKGIYKRPNGEKLLKTT